MTSCENQQSISRLGYNFGNYCAFHKHANCRLHSSLRTEDVFPVVASLPPKNNVYFRRKKSNDRKYVCGSQATFTDDIRIPRRPWDERLHSMIARLKRGLFGKNTYKHWLVAAESLQNCRNQQKTARFKSWNLTGKLKGYLFQKTKLWEELVVLTAKLKKPRSQKKKQQVIKKMAYCVKMSILESFL